MLTSAHKGKLREPIQLPDGRGTLPSTGQPFVFPVVVDANAIRDDLLRIAARGERTILVSAANYGIVRLFCARHVAEEVDEHMAEWAAQKGVPLADVRRTWTDTVAPLLRVVDVPEGLTTSDEQARLDVLADPRAGDPDDVPTATLALLLEAPLLSKDHKPLTAVYGEELDYDRHVRWLVWLRTSGNLGALEDLSTTLHAGTSVLINAADRGGRALAGKAQWPWLLAVPVATAIAVRLLVPADARRKVLDLLTSVVETAADVSVEIGQARREMRARLTNLPPRQPTVARVVAERGAAAGLARLCLHVLARSARSDSRAVEVGARLPQLPGGVQPSTKAVTLALRSWACFTQPSPGRYQVGRPVSRPRRDVPPHHGPVLLDR